MNINKTIKGFTPTKWAKDEFGYRLYSTAISGWEKTLSRYAVKEIEDKDFYLHCGCGIMIRGKRFCATAQNISYRGNFNDFWQNICQLVVLDAQLTAGWEVEQNGYFTPLANFVEEIRFVEDAE